MANYILRKVDDTLWQSFRARAQTEGHSLRWLLLELIQRYVNGGLK
jgi:plasmid stability protein